MPRVHHRLSSGQPCPSLAHDVVQFLFDLEIDGASLLVRVGANSQFEPIMSAADGLLVQAETEGVQIQTANRVTVSLMPGRIVIGLHERLDVLPDRANECRIHDVFAFVARSEGDVLMQATPGSERG